MPEEIGKTLENLQNLSETKFGDLKLISGEWFQSKETTQPVYVTIAWSGWGKVSSARAATRIISSSYKGKCLDILFFTGVAGAISPDLKQWDVIIPDHLIQHDMDASPLFEKYQIPAFNKAKIDSNIDWINWARISLSNINNELDKFGKIGFGLIATGDQFITKKTTVEKLRNDLPDLKAVEMEGAAVAQVAVQEEIPWLIIRVISDEADHSSPQDFNDFIKDYQNYSWNLIKALLNNFKSAPLKRHEIEK